MNNNLIIFSKYLNKDKSLFKKESNKVKSFVGKQKYTPPVSKEWKNNIYAFNIFNLKNLPVFDININELIKNYFNLYFNPKFLHIKKYKNHKSFNKIFVSKAEVKHNNNKAIITVYVYNREKISLLKRIKFIEDYYFRIANYIKFLEFPKELYINPSTIYLKFVKATFIKELILLRKYKLRLNLNKNKFEEKLLFKLKNLIVKFFNKKVEFNIVNLKSIIFNSDFFTRMLAQKTKNNNNVLKTMNKILNKVVIPKVNKIIEKSATIKSIDFNLLENRFKSLNVSSILNNNNLWELLNNLYYNVYSNSKDFFNKNYAKIYEIIFNSIKYKNIGGVRLEAKGRLSKRSRADRSKFKVKWKGGLRNIDSSYKGLSTANIRGYQRINLDYTLFTSKRRVGAFAVKGWVSGKNYSTSSRPQSFPVIKYTNAESDKPLIIKENKGKAGVYRWINNLNGNSYIGSSKSLDIRLKNYFSPNFLNRELKTSESRIYRAIRKNGYSNFSLEILEYCNPSDAVSIEQKYLDLLKPEYNILKKAGSLLGFKHSEKTLLKFKARILTLEQRVKQLEALKIVHSDKDYQAKRLEAIMNYNNSDKKQEDLKRFSHSVVVLDTLTNVKTTYTSKAKAAKAIKCSAPTISIALREFKEKGTYRLIGKKYLILPVEETNTKSLIGALGTKNIKFKVVDTLDGSTSIHLSMNEAAKAIGCDISTISKASKKLRGKEKDLILIFNRYELTLIDTKKED